MPEANVHGVEGLLCGVDRLSGNSYDHRRTWIRDRLESLAGLFGVSRPGV
jgi:hypothetical protein